MTSKRNNNILIRLKIICVIKKRALIFWYYKTTILKKKKKVSQKFLSRQKPISVGSKMISRNSDKFRETTEGSFEKFIGVSRNHFGPNGNRFLPRQKFLRHFFLFFEYSSFIISKNKGLFFYYIYYFQL